jgi:hypothetical protein
MGSFSSEQRLGRFGGGPLMREKNTRFLLEYAVIITLVVGFLAFWAGGQKSSDIDFCRNVFNDLINARGSAEKFIDWENFKAFNIDSGTIYQLTDRAEKEDYKTGFILGFAAGFKRVGGKLSDYTHWRIYNKEEQKVIVAADVLVKKQTLFFTLSKKGKRKLIGLEYVQKKP